MAVVCIRLLHCSYDESGFCQTLEKEHTLEPMPLQRESVIRHEPSDLIPYLSI